MRRNPFILRCTAFLLLLVFTQKAGAGLFIHNALHASAAKVGHSEDRRISYSCTCGDDFLLPFINTEEISFETPVSNSIELISVFKESTDSYTILIPQLRGPPFFTV